MNNIDKLVKEYEEELTDFSEQGCVRLLNLYLWRMEDCQVKALLYKYLEHKGDLL